LAAQHFCARGGCGSNPQQSPSLEIQKTPNRNIAADAGFAVDASAFQLGRNTMKCFAAAALVLLAATPALAQAAPEAGTAPGATISSNAPSKANLFVTQQSPNQWLAGNLWNKSVYNAAGQPIGDLKDVLVGPDGKVQALIIGVGGFLGLGEKNVAVDYSFLEKNGAITPGRITLNMTEQDLRSAPAFVRMGSGSK
jgi:sporulation protein YlmC with PRC-barrel domain